MSESLLGRRYHELLSNIDFTTDELSSSENAALTEFFSYQLFFDRFTIYGSLNDLRLAMEEDFDLLNGRDFWMIKVG